MHNSMLVSNLDRLRHGLDQPRRFPRRELLLADELGQIRAVHVVHGEKCWPRCSATSWIATMFGWRSLAAAAASARKRFMADSSANWPKTISLTATMRSR